MEVEIEESRLVKSLPSRLVRTSILSLFSPLMASQKG